MITLATVVSQKSLKKNFIIQSMERKKIGQLQEEKEGWEGWFQSHDTIHYYKPNTKYDYSSLQMFTEIFDEILHYSKYGKKENRTNTEKNKHEKAGLQSHDTIYHNQPA